MAANEIKEKEDKINIHIKKKKMNKFGRKRGKKRKKRNTFLHW